MSTPRLRKVAWTLYEDTADSLSLHHNLIRQGVYKFFWCNNRRDSSLNSKMDSENLPATKHETCFAQKNTATTRKWSELSSFWSM